MRSIAAIRPLIFTFFILLLIGPLSTSIRSASGLTRLSSSGDVTAFEWSSSGRELFVTRNARVISISTAQKQTTGDLYRVDANTGVAGLLAQNASFAAPAPDGMRLAFVSLLNDGSGRLNLLDLGTGSRSDLGPADWGEPPQWTRHGDELIYSKQGHPSAQATATAPVQLSARTLPVGFAASPSGDRIAFGAADGLHLLVGGQDIRAFETTGTESVQTGMRWSHTGKSLAFVVTRDGVEPELWLIEADGTNARKILNGRLEYFAGLEWAPDDSHLLLTRTPTGSSNASASEIWDTRTDGSSARALTQNRAEEASPKYSPDGRQIAFLRGGDLWLMSLDQVRLPLTDANPAINSSVQPVLPVPPRALTGQLSPPATIRVYHSQNNSCRAEPVGQIDTLDFETYVKRVVPAEVYSTWAAEALKTQAVAARSYAWFWVLQHTTWDYDVTDSTAYQYMCNNQYASTDAAVDATRGQYGDYGGNIIFAAYGANNGDPTQTNSWNNPYLIAVDDPVDFMNPVAGNGIGMSQWGAQRWASPPYNRSYQQILMHYYTGVTIQAPAGVFPDTTPPISALIQPWSNWGLTSNHLALVGSASDDSSSLSATTFSMQYFDGSVNRTTNWTPAYDGQYWNYVADLSSIPDQAGIVVTPKVTDASGNTSTGSGINLMLDRNLPTGTLSAPASTDLPVVTLNLTATDNGPGGVAQMAFSNNWVWEGENQSVTAGSGTVVSDPAALNGMALEGQLGVNPAGEWYGPYTSILTLGNAYRAYFRLKTDDATTTNEVALLDVVDNSGTNLLGLKRLRGTDFVSANAYQEFYVDFYYTGTVTNGLEFRVAYRATASLWLDRIIVVSYPVPFAASTQWTCRSGTALRKIQAKIIDGAGNVSADLVARIWVGTTPTPTATVTPTRGPTWTPTVTRTPTATPILFPKFWLPFILH